MPFYHERPPAAALARWIECGWCLQNTKAVAPYPVPPDGCIDIVYERGSGLRVVGTMTTQQRFAFTETAEFTGIRFRPGMAKRFLGVSAAELTDIAVPFDDIQARPARELSRRLDDAHSIQKAMAILMAAAPLPDPALTPAQRAIEALTQVNGNTNLDITAQQAGLSTRQFRRLCLEEAGLSPKRLCRILRFRYASQLALRCKRAGWAAIALHAGYFDQAHLIRDFREFTGTTPMAVFSNTPAPQAR